VKTLLPFSAASKIWEPFAQELRSLAGLHESERLCPFALAPKVGLVLVDGHEAIGKLDQKDRSHLQGAGRTEWSGGVCPKPLPDGTFLCIVNPFHSERRNKITLMEEIVHIFRRHTPTQMRCNGNGVSVRGYNKETEAEAYGIGAAALLPWSEFFRALNSGSPASKIAEDFEVTDQLVEYRIKITGAYNVYRKRQARSA
jgi:hypothetical protein